MPLQRAARRLGSLLRDVLEAVLLAAVLFFVLQLGLQSTVVDGYSMEPNFVHGEWVIVNKLAYRLGEPRRGDVVVFHAPAETDRDFIKRVVGLPGEEVRIVDRTLYVDGRAVDEPWLPIVDATSFGPYRVPQGHVVVFGDNRPNSNDSRTWHDPSLAESRIVGRVALSVWPPATWGVVRSDAPGPARGMRAAADER